MDAHIRPALVVRDDLRSNVGDGADADGKRDEVEILRHAKGLGARAAAVPVGLEMPAFRLRCLAVLELRVIGLRRPARLARDVHERLVFAAAFDFGLHVEGQAGDMAAVFGKARVGEAVEEFELHPAVAHGGVERGKDDIAHAGTHPPHEGTAIAEEGAQGAAQALTSGQRRLALIAVLIAHRQVVKPAQEGRLQRPDRSAVDAHPFAALVIVDRVEPALVGEDAIADHAGDCRHREIGDLPHEAMLVVGDPLVLDPLPQLRQYAFGCLEQPVRTGRGHRPQQRGQNAETFGQRRRSRKATEARKMGEAVRNVARAGMLEIGDRRLAVDLGVQHQRLQQFEGPRHVVREREAGIGRQRIAGQAGARRHMHAPAGKAAALIGGMQGDVVFGRPRIAPVAVDVALAGGFELGMALAHHAEGVVVETQPDVEAVFLDPARNAAARSALAAKAPAFLIDGDLVFPVMFGTREFPRQRHRSAAAADDGNPCGRTAQAVIPGMARPVIVKMFRPRVFASPSDLG